MQQADGDGLDVLLAQLRDCRTHAGLVERHYFRTVGRDAFGDLKAAIARGRRCRLQDVEVEIMWAALARELDDVAKTGRRQHAGARGFAFEHGVGAERRAEHEKLDRLARQFRKFDHFRNAVEHRLRGIAGRRRELVIGVTAARHLAENEIGERAAGVDADPDFGHGKPSHNSRGTGHLSTPELM